MTLATVQGIPAIEVRLGLSALSPETLSSLQRVLVQQRLSVPTLCELLFVMPTRREADVLELRLGAALNVAVSDESQPLFSGEITAVEYVHLPSRIVEIRLRAYDPLHRLRKRQPVRAHFDVNLRDLARELVADLGLAVEADVSTPIWPHIIQCDESDLELLTRLGDRTGVHLFLQGTTLQLLTLAGTGPEVPLRLGDTLLEARFERNTDAICRKVMASGWDPATIQLFEGVADSPRRAWAGGTDVDPTDVGGTGSRALLNQSATRQAEIEARAQAELDERSSRGASVRGTAVGDPRLVPGTRVVFDDVSPSVAGTYALTSVTHSIDRLHGFVSSFSSEPPARRTIPQVPLATYGTVTRIDDPDGLGRVRVALPAYANLETEWLSVLTVGAGADKGFVMLPDTGDRVLVLMPHGDAAHGIVLGGLFGTVRPPDTGIENNAVARGTFVTRGRQRLQLDDQNRLVRLETSDGSFVELRPDRMALHAATDLVIEAPGRTITIQAQQIDFEKK